MGAFHSTKNTGLKCRYSVWRMEQYLCIIAPSNLNTSFSMYQCVLLWLSSVCWDKNKTSHFGIFLATGVAVYLHNSGRKITLQKHKKHQPSKSKGKTGIPLKSVTENREWMEGKIVFACLRHVSVGAHVPRFGRIESALDYVDSIDSGSKNCARAEWVNGTVFSGCFDFPEF